MDTFRDLDYRVLHRHTTMLYRPIHWEVLRENIFVHDRPPKFEILCSSERDTINFAFVFVCHLQHFLQHLFLFDKIYQHHTLIVVQSKKKIKMTYSTPSMIFVFFQRNLDRLAVFLCNRCYFHCCYLTKYCLVHSFFLLFRKVFLEGDDGRKKNDCKNFTCVFELYKCTDDMTDER